MIIYLYLTHVYTVDTTIVPIGVKIFMAGIPLTPVERVAGAIFYAASDPDMETSGCPWLLPDDGYLFRIKREELKEGVYEMLNDRTAALIKYVFSHKLDIGPALIFVYRACRGSRGVKHGLAIVGDLWRLLGKQTILFGTIVAGANYLYMNKEAREFVQQHAAECMDWVGASAGKLLQ